VSGEKLTSYVNRDADTRRFTPLNRVTL